MVRILLFIMLFSTSLISSLHAKDWDYKIGLGIRALTIDSDKLRARIWSVNPTIASAYKLGNVTRFNFDFGATLESGSNRALLIDEYSPKKTLYIKRANFDFRLFEGFKFEAGAINQNIYDSPIFLSSLAFVGIRQNFSFSLVGLKIKIIASQSIPNNDSLSSRLAIVEEGTPLFYAETLKIDSKIGHLSTSIAYTHFNFKNISQDVAWQSRDLGNTVTGSAAANASFLYNFQGHNSTLALDFKHPSFYTGFKLQFLHNNYAPNSKADSLYLSLQLGHPEFYVQVEKYDIESDATIAYYNSGDYGHTNRAGYAFGATYKAKTMNTSLMYHTQDVIVDTGLFQSKRDVVTLDFKKNF